MKEPIQRVVAPGLAGVAIGVAVGIVATLPWWGWPAVVVVAFVAAVGIRDVVQRRHAIIRNYPVIGHLRYLLESIGPELRQYIVTDNDAERPFSRDQRRWVYATAKGENNLFGFGTDNDVLAEPGYLVIRHAAFPAPEPPPHSPAGSDLHLVPMAKVLGAARNRPGAFRPDSVVNLSSMSYGSLSGSAVRALNAGARLAHALHGTGEGGISPYHLEGGDLVWQLGTAYFGARDHEGRFSLDRFLDKVERYPVRAVEIKLSQGAKPGLGGMLPGAKVTPEIAAIRGIPVGVDCKSPARHTAFTTVPELLDFVELLARESGLPVGIKAAVGQMDFWEELADRMATDEAGVDFITIDGGEGGTGAAPMIFADHVSLPFLQGFAAVYRIFARRGIHNDVVWFGSGRLGLPDRAVLAFALGVDGINVAREAMLALGCIQAQKCHTGHCPVGVATQSRWLERGLDPSLKSVRVANYLVGFRRELLRVANAVGVDHPAEIGVEHLDLLDEAHGSTPVARVFDYKPDWGSPTIEQLAEARRALLGIPTPQEA
ncbi:MAG TPA: FMN-binding glutamate synthase family protein [Actinobacteria bacterium]|nr:FMN-binding glutamate synthase family protein [Actinomycetota bacterium]